MALHTDTIIVDADALIALVDSDDPLSQRALSLARQLQEAEVSLLYPATTITEAATTFQRKLQKPDLVAHIVSAAQARQFLIEPVDQTILEEAAVLFKPHGSKKNTLFDAIVAAVAKHHHARAVFSFDEWYQKVGLPLVSDVM
jgi:predicted nucleic acid-binding protein